MGTVAIGGVTFNIFGDHKGTGSADEYFKASVNASEWSAASQANQKKAMVSTARTFNQQRWKGTKTDLVTPQPLAWPRTGVTDKDGQAVSDSVTPTDIIEGSYEYALYLLKNPSAQDLANTDENIKRLKAGSVELERFKPISGPRFPNKVQELVGFYLAGSGVSSGAEAFGTDGESIYSDELYPLSEGFA